MQFKVKYLFELHFQVQIFIFRGCLKVLGMTKTLKKCIWEKHAKESQTREDFSWIFMDFHGAMHGANLNFINGVAYPKMIILKTLQIEIINNNKIITSNDNYQAVSQFYSICSSDSHRNYVQIYFFYKKPVKGHSTEGFLILLWF